MSARLSHIQNPDSLTNLSTNLCCHQITADPCLGNLWVGYSDNETEGTWIDIHGQITIKSSLPWSGRNPDNNGKGEHCAELTNSGLLNDVHCSNERNYLCVKG